MALFNLTASAPRATQIVYAGQPPGIIVNRDITNIVVLANDQAIDPTRQGDLLDPLTFVAYTGDDDIFAKPQTGTALLDVIPNVTNWTPSPGQSAAQIAGLGLMLDSTGQIINGSLAGVSKDATLLTINGTLGTPSQQSLSTLIPNNIAIAGVPAINQKSTTPVASGQAIAAGVTANLTPVMGINQPAYNLHFTATAGVGSTQPWYTVTLKWTDTASGFVVQVDSFTFLMSATSNVMSGVIAGPTDADQLQVSVQNNDTVAMTLNTVFFVLSSRNNYTADLCYQFWTTAGMPSVPTFQLGHALQVPTSKILFALARSVGIGVTTTPQYVLPVYSGPVFIHFDGGSSNNWDVQFIEQTTGVILARISITAAGAQNNFITQFPRSPVATQITNNGTVLGNINLMVVGA